MARPPRIEFPGAFYHVIVRGNQQQDIFLDEQDRVEYFERIMRYKEKCGFIIYAYVLMTNHVHLLVETTKAPISKVMQLINFTYTQYFNKKHGKVGHLFQGRYKSFLCDRDEYLLGLVRYIHLNPVRAKIVKEPHEYKWSSHKDYMKGHNSFIDTDRVLRLFSERISHAIRLYRDFVKEAMRTGKEDAFYKAACQQILGDEKFIEKVEKKLEKLNKPLRNPSLKEIFRAVEEVTDIAEDEIVSRSRRKEVIIARGIVVCICREFGYSLVDLQHKFKRDISVLSRLSKIVDGEGERQLMEQVLRRLNAYTQA